MPNLIGRLVGDAIQILIQFFFAWLIWRYYKRRTYPTDQKYNTFAPRFWTGWVDSCVLLPFGFLITLPLVFGKPSPWIAAATVLLQNIVWLTYTIWMHAQRGQTVGKIVCKIRVVDNATEGPLTLGQAVLRESIPLVVSIGLIAYQVELLASGALSNTNPPQPPNLDPKLFGLVAAFPFLWFLAEVITMLTNDKRRALHDFLAGTCVIRTNVVTVETTTV